MSQAITAKDRAEYAKQAGLHEQYLYQCMTGRRDMDAALAVRVEQDTGGALRRWHLRPKDWHLVWPELVKVKGAPQIPEQAGQGA